MQYRLLSCNGRGGRDGIVRRFLRVPANSWMYQFVPSASIIPSEVTGFLSCGSFHSVRLHFFSFRWGKSMFGGQLCALVDGKHGSQLGEDICHKPIVRGLATFNGFESKEEYGHIFGRSARVCARNRQFVGVKRLKAVERQ